MGRCERIVWGRGTLDKVVREGLSEEVAIQVRLEDKKRPGM